MLIKDKPERKAIMRVLAKYKKDAKIEKFLSDEEKEKAFIFVGLYHLDFKEGLLELLKSRGYSVEEIILN